MEEYALIVLIAEAIASMPAFYPERNDESYEERYVRSYPIAEAIYDASERRPKGINRMTMIAAMISLGREESKFAKYVGEGRCKDGPTDARCDPDKNGEPRARTYWQHWQASCPSAWSFPQGSREELFAAAKCTAGRLTSEYNRCLHRAESPWAGAFSGFRSADCTWEEAPRRAANMQRVWSQLQKRAAE